MPNYAAAAAARAAYKAITTPRPRTTINVSDRIAAQVSFWNDPAPVRGFVAGVGSGKTTAGAIEILRMPPATRGIVIAPTYPMMRDASQASFFELCPPSLIKSHHKQEQHTTLLNGVEIYWRSADRPRSLRGPNLGWAWGDEWAFCPTDEAHKIVLSRLRRAPGRMWFTTTPNGQNWLYEWCCLKNLGYSLHHAHTRDNPFNLATYAADLARQYESDPLFALQELSGAFVDLSGSKRMPAALLERATHSPPRLKAPQLPHITVERDGRRHTYTFPHTALRLYLKPSTGRRWVIGVDCAEGIPGGDDSAAVVMDVTTGEVAAILSGEYEPQEEWGAHLAALSRYFSKAPVNIERNNHGHAVIASCRRHGVRCLSGPDKRPGWCTSAPSKARMWNEAHHNLTSSGEVPTIPDRRLKIQIGGINRLTLKGPGKGKGAAKIDDEAIAYGLAQVGRALAVGTQARSAAKMANLLRGMR